MKIICQVQTQERTGEAEKYICPAGHEIHHPNIFHTPSLFFFLHKFKNKDIIISPGALFILQCGLVLIATLTTRDSPSFSVVVVLH